MDSTRIWPALKWGPGALLLLQRPFVAAPWSGRWADEVCHGSFGLLAHAQTGLGVRCAVSLVQPERPPHGGRSGTGTDRYDASFSRSSSLLAPPPNIIQLDILLAMRSLGLAGFLPPPQEVYLDDTSLGFSW